MKAVVIGAGPAGLAAAAALRSTGIRPVILDRGAAVGESWRSRYDRLRLNTAREHSALPFTAIGSQHGRWVSRDAYAAYLAAYASEHNLEPSLGVLALRVERTGRGWHVHLEGGDALEAPVVVVATGHECVPEFPAWPGLDRFTGSVLHSSDYKNAREFAGRRVLVAGTGSSGLEIAVDLIEGGAREVRVALREAPNLFPRAFMGIAMLPQGLSLLLRLPTPLADVAGAVLQRIVWGDLRRFGFPRAGAGFASNLRKRGKGPVFDDHFAGALRKGRCTIVAAVERLEATHAVLADGTALEVDAVVAATGYRRGLEPLVGELGVLDERGVPRYNAKEDPGNPGLFFIGYALPPLVHLAEGALAIAAAAARVKRRDFAPHNNDVSPLFAQVTR